MSWTLRLLSLLWIALWLGSFQIFWTGFETLTIERGDPITGCLALLIAFAAWIVLARAGDWIVRRFRRSQGDDRA